MPSSSYDAVLLIIKWCPLKITTSVSKPCNVICQITKKRVICYRSFGNMSLIWKALQFFTTEVLSLMKDFESEIVGVSESNVCPCH